MSTAIFEVPHDRHPLALPTGVVLALALHVGVAVLLTLAPWAKQETPKPEFVMEVVQLPKKPEPPKVEPPPPPPPVMEAPAPPPPPIPRMVPQLTEAPIAEKSSPPPQETKTAAPAHEKPAPRTPPKPAAPAPKALPVNTQEAKATPTPATPREREHEAGASGGKVEPASQTVQDFILMQIASAWIIDLQSPRFRNLDISWGFVLRPDGYLAPPFGKNDPWDLRRMVDPRTYAVMQEQSEEGRYFTTVVTTFLQAVRQAQPFRVPPKEESYVNRALPLRFHAGDLVQGAGSAHGGG